MRIWSGLEGGRWNDTGVCVGLRSGSAVSVLDFLLGNDHDECSLSKEII